MRRVACTRGSLVTNYVAKLVQASFSHHCNHFSSILFVGSRLDYPKIAWSAPAQTLVIVRSV